MTRSPFGAEERALLQDVPANIRDLAILAKACAYRCLAHDSIEPMEELKHELYRLAFGAEANIRALLEKVEEQERAAVRREEHFARREAHFEQAKLAAATEIVAESIGEYFSPTGCFVYILWGAYPEEDGPLYIGKSTNILSRLGSHMQDRGRRSLTKKVQLIRCSRTLMDATELRLIRHYRPRFNIAGMPA